MSSNPFNKLQLPAISNEEYLRFRTNSKLRQSNTTGLSLPAGYSCPGACECLSWFDRKEKKLRDGEQNRYRCFAASSEAAYPSVRALADRNYAILKRARTTARMAATISMSLPSLKFPNIRIHVDGDFFNQSYFLAWCQVASDHQDRVFYAYTKSLPIWVKMRACVPRNLVLIASRGGKWDNLIDQHGLRSAVVVFHPSEAEALGLQIDHDESLARDPDHGDFALLLHGVQPAGSDAAKAQKRLRAENIKFAYGRGKNAIK